MQAGVLGPVNHRPSARTAPRGQVNEGGEERLRLRDARAFLIQAVGDVDLIEQVGDCAGDSGRGRQRNRDAAPSCRPRRRTAARLAKTVTDEQWIALNAADDETWYARLERDFGF